MSSKRKSTDILQGDSPGKAMKPNYCKPDTKKNIWTFDDRCRLVEAINDEKFRKFPGLIRKYIGSKSVGEVTTYMKYLKLLESGTVYREFREQSAALDAWLELMEKTTQDDKKAEQCIPQIMTVAALEPRNMTGDNTKPCPNYLNVYNYLAMILKGEEPGDLPPIDAQVLLCLLDDLTEKFRNSLALLQKEFLHEAYGVLNSTINTAGLSSNANNGEDSPAQVVQTNETVKKFPSLNPLNVPAMLLEFRKKKPIVLDFSTNWRTKLS